MTSCDDRMEPVSLRMQLALARALAAMMPEPRPADDGDELEPRDE